VPHWVWIALGIIEMIGGILLIVPAAINAKPRLTALAAMVLTIETVALVLIYGSYSTEFNAQNPMVWAIIMAVMVAFVAWARNSRVTS
jgi:VIT1/CCC1 family predicted Fe2+/Mn2+ transporter